MKPTRMKQNTEDRPRKVAYICVWMAIHREEIYPELYFRGTSLETCISMLLLLLLLCAWHSLYPSPILSIIKHRPASKPHSTTARLTNRKRISYSRASHCSPHLFFSYDCFSNITYDINLKNYHTP